MTTLPKVQPSGGTPTTQDFVSLQTQWMRFLNPLLDAFRIGDGIPVGVVWSWASTTAPDKFLICNSAVVLQKQYPQLFLAIGTAYNTGGEPAGSFRLPAASGAFTLIIKAFP